MQEAVIKRAKELLADGTVNPCCRLESRRICLRYHPCRFHIG